MKKIYEATGKVIASDDKALILEHFISTDTPDRDGDIVVPDGVKISGIPVVLQQHGFDTVAGTEPIAKVLEIRIGAHKGGSTGLIARTQYYDGSGLTPPDNTGRRLYEKARDGFMPNFSIGFNVIKSEPLASGGRRITEAELFEYSQVAIPANPEATSIVKSLSFTIDKEKSMPPQGFNTIEVFLSETEPCEAITSCEIAKPYANEHACRLRDPGDFSTFRRKNGDREVNGKPIDVIYGKEKKGDKWAVQALRYPKDKWTADDARQNCDKEKGSFEAAKQTHKSIADRVATSIPIEVMSQLFNGFMCEVSLCGDDEKAVKRLIKELSELIEPAAIAFAKACMPKPEPMIKAAIAKAFGIVYKAEDEGSTDSAPDGTTVPDGATMAADSTAMVSEATAKPVMQSAQVIPAVESAAQVVPPVPATAEPAAPPQPTTIDQEKSMILRIRQDVSPTALTKKDIEAYVRDALRSGFGDAMQSELRRAMGKID